MIKSLIHQGRNEQSITTMKGRSARSIEDDRVQTVYYLEKSEAYSPSPDVLSSGEPGVCLYFLRPERESNPRMAVLQTAALPLRHPAVDLFYHHSVMTYLLQAGFLYGKLNQFMRLATRLSLVSLAAILLAACNLPFGSRNAGIQVGANPQSVVFIDGKNMGQTPVYVETLKPGDVTVRIEPNDKSLAPWEGKVSLNEGTLTVIDRQLAADVTKSHGYSLTFEKLTNKTSSEISVITFPDNVALSIDGAPVGFTPYKGDSQTVGTHTLLLTSPGYEDQTIKAKINQGYRLVVNVQLASQAITPTPELTPLVATPSATPSLTPKAGVTPKVDITPLPKQASSSAVTKPYVEILSTPTGWLKVRAEANASSAEVAKVNPGDRFPYLDINGSWYEITYIDGKQGWVSAQYTKLVK